MEHEPSTTPHPEPKVTTLVQSEPRPHMHQYTHMMKHASSSPNPNVISQSLRSPWGGKDTRTCNLALRGPLDTFITQLSHCFFGVLTLSVGDKSMSLQTCAYLMKI